eukprot:3181971-Rhodomonas_salina.1
MQPEISVMETLTLASAPLQENPAATPLRACSISSLDILPATIDCRGWLCLVFARRPRADLQRTQTAERIFAPNEDNESRAADWMQQLRDL